MRLDEYAACDATALADLVRRGEVTAGEVYETAVAAIRGVDAELGAVADGPWEAPLDYAADGPFGGVPTVLKDLGPHPAGVPGRAGSRLSGDGVAHEHDSFLITKMRDAGFAIAALSTAPEIGYNASSEALVYGRPTRNPWDLARSAGGSSGGSGALVGAGAVPIAHANDGGGSIRIPAALNGVVGLKPSRGRLSIGPDHQEVLDGFAMEFAHTRTMRDCAAALDALSGALPGDKFIVRDPVRPWAQEVGADPGRLRVAVHTEPWSGHAVDPEVAATVEAVGRQLQELGHEVEAATPRVDWDAFVGAQVPLYCAWNAQAVEELAAASGKVPGPDTLEAAVLAAWEYGRGLTVVELAAARSVVNDLVREVGAFHTRYDLLLTPTVAVPAYPLGHLDANDQSFDVEGWARHVFGPCCFTPLFNWTGTPAISLPLGSTSDGLPIGVQLAAPMCREDLLIQVGSQLEQAMPWGDRRPAVHAGALVA